MYRIRALFFYRKNNIFIDRIVCVFVKECNTKIKIKKNIFFLHKTVRHIHNKTILKLFIRPLLRADWYPWIHLQKNLIIGFISYSIQRILQSIIFLYINFVWNDFRLYFCHLPISLNINSSWYSLRNWEDLCSSRNKE